MMGEESMDRVAHLHRQIGQIVLVVFTLLLLAGHHASAAQQQATDTRNAFMLGFVFGNAHNLYSQRPSLEADAGAVYEEWMADARQYANSLGVSVDTTPPSYDPSSRSIQSDIIRAGRNKAELLTIQILSRHSQGAAAALQLGYKSALANEYVPYIASSMQVEVATEYKSLAMQAGLPMKFVEKYIDTLRSTRDRQTTIRAMFAFKDDVLGHFEGLAMTDTSGIRRQMNIWSMGWSLGLATIGQTRGADPAAVSRIFEKCRTRAEILGVNLPMLPEASTDNARDTARAIHYLLNEAGDTIGGELKAKYGPRAAALFELAIKSTLSLLVYSEEDEMSQTLMEVIDRSGRDAGLPESIYKPVVDKMRARAPYASVKAEISAMDKRITTYLNPDGN
jgi:hypothetical protein